MADDEGASAANYSALQQQFNSLKVKAKSKISQLQGVIDGLEAKNKELEEKVAATSSAATAPAATTSTVDQEEFNLLREQFKASQLAMVKIQQDEQEKRALLEQQLSEARASLSQIQGNLTDNETALTQLSAAKMDLQVQLENSRQGFESEKSALLKEIQLAKEEAIKAKEQAAASSSAINEGNASILEALKREKAMLSEDFENMRLQNTALTTKLRDMDSELQQREAALEAEREDLRNQLSELQVKHAEKVEALSIEISNLKSFSNSLSASTREEGNSTDISSPVQTPEPTGEVETLESLQKKKLDLTRLVLKCKATIKSRTVEVEKLKEQLSELQQQNGQGQEKDTQQSRLEIVDGLYETIFGKAPDAESDRVKEINDEINRNREKIESLETRLSSLEIEKNSDLEKTQTAFEQEKAAIFLSLNEKLQHLELVNQEKSEEIKALQERNNSAQKNYQQLEADFSKLRETKEQEKHQVSALKEELSRIKKEAEEETKELQSRIDHLVSNDQSEASQQKLLLAESNLKSITEELVQIKSTKLKELEETNASLTQQLNQLKEEQDGLESAKNEELEAAKSKIHSLEEEIIKIKAEKSDNESAQVTELQISVQALTEQLNQVRSEKESEASSLSNELEAVRTNLATLTEELNRIKMEKSEVAKEIDASNSKINALTEELNQLKEGNSSLEDERAKELESAKLTVSSLSEELKQLKDEHARGESEKVKELEAATSTIASLNEELNKLKEGSTNDESAKKELEIATSTVSSLNEELAKVKHDFESGQQLNMKLKIKLKETMKTNEENNGKIKELTAQLTKVQESAKNHNEDLPLWMSRAAQFEATNQTLSKQLEEKTKQASELQEAATKADQLAQQLGTIEQQLKYQEQMYETLKQENENVQGILMDREKEVEFLNRTLQEKEASYLEMQNRIAEQVEVQRDFESNNLAAVAALANGGNAVNSEKTDALKNQLKGLERQLGEKDQKIKQLEANLRKQNASGIDVLQARIQELESETVSLQQKLAASGTSSSHSGTETQDIHHRGESGFERSELAQEWKKRLYSLEQVNLELTRQVNDYKLFYNSSNAGNNGTGGDSGAKNENSRRMSSLLSSGSPTASQYLMEAGAMGSGSGDQIKISDVLVLKGRNRITRTFRNIFAYIDQQVVRGGPILRVTLVVLFIAAILFIIFERV